jgi:exoribonuclease-2
MMSLGDSLDRVARERVTSIFLPEARYPMLPPPLASKHFSLLPNRINHTLSFVIRLSSDAEIISYEITPATISSVQCLSYEQADKLYDEKNTSQSTALHLLASLAEKRKSKRIRDGAIPGSIPNVDVSVAAEGAEIKLSKLDSDSVTRGLVQEFMILVGEVTADFASRHSIALPFRSQLQRHDADLGLDSPQPNLSCVQLDLGWLSEILTHWHRRSMLLPPFTSPEPKAHRGLGVKSYTQATSPIRRYADLLVHYQIKAVLRGETPPLARDKLISILDEMEQRQQEVSRLQSHSQRYWILRYLETQDASRTYLALVLSVNSHQRINNIHVVFVDLGYKTALTLESHPKSGDVLKLRALHVDAFENDVIFVEV